jgi:UDP-glucose 4-epimerase
VVKPKDPIVKNCLVTGGSGFIGSHLVEGLLAKGATVRVLDDLSTGRLANLAGVAERIDLVEGSVTDHEDVAEAVAGCDTVFHLAALPSVVKSVEDPLQSHEIAATGTLRVLDAARRAGVKRLVFAASSSAYGDQPGAVRTEDDPLMPMSPYAAAKLAGEHYCSCFTTVYGLETVRLRFFNVFGPRQDPQSPYSGVIALFTSWMSAGRAPTVLGDGLQTRDFVYVENVVQALLLAAGVPAASGRVYNVGNGQSITILDLVRHLNELLGKNLKPSFAPPRAGDVRHSEADITRARKELGYDPAISFREGLARTLAAHQKPV